MADKSTSSDFYNVYNICTCNNSRILDSYSPGTVVSCRTSKKLVENPPSHSASYPVSPKKPSTVLSFAPLSSMVTVFWAPNTSSAGDTIERDVQKKLLRSVAFRHNIFPAYSMIFYLHPPCYGTFKPCR